MPTLLLWQGHPQGVPLNSPNIDVLVGVGLVPTLIPWGVQLSNLASTVVGVSQLQSNLCIDRNC